MSAPAIRLSYNVSNHLSIASRTRFSWENQQLIARARAGCFGGVYNPSNSKSIAKGLRHNADQYRAHVRDLSSRSADSWRAIPPEFTENHNFKDKGVMKKINALLKANNTYQTPKR